MPPDFDSSDLAALLSQVRKNINHELKNAGGADNLNMAEKKALASEQTRKALEAAGVTDSELNANIDEKIKEYIDLGVSPRTAATAATSSVMTPVAASAGELAVEGYVIKEVGEASVCYFNSTETMEVKNSVIHNYFSPMTYEVGSHNFKIDCTTITTKASSDWARAHSGTAVGDYQGNYKAAIGGSVTAYWRSTKWGGASKNVAGGTSTFTALRTQLTAVEVEVIGRNNSRWTTLTEAVLMNVVVAPFIKEDTQMWELK